jgi:hypothetical protein
MLPIYGSLHFVPAVLFKWKVFTQDPGKVLLKAGLGSLRSSAFLGVFVVIYQSKSIPLYIINECESRINFFLPHRPFFLSLALFCYKHNLHKFLTLLRSGALHTNFLTSSFKHLPQWVINLLISKMSFWILGLASGLSLVVEEKRRRGELAMYVLPKGLESIWVTARGKGLVFGTGKWGDVILAALGMAMVMVNEFYFFSQKEKEKTRMPTFFFLFFYQIQSTYQNDPQHLSGLVRRILYQFIGPN